MAAKAQTTWNDPTTNNFWNVAGNWSNGVPTSDTDVYFSGTGGDILVSASVSNGFKSLNFNASNSNYTLSSSDGTVRNLFAPSASGGFRGALNANDSHLTIERLSITANAGSSFANNGSGNFLTLTGAGTKLTVAYNAGFSIGSGNGTIAANSNNTVTVQNGAALAVGLLGVGGKGAGNSLIITGTGSQLKIVGTAANYDLVIGNSSSAATNSVKIINGATAEVTQRNTRIVGGSLVVGKDSSLSHTAPVNVQTLTIGSKGTLFGAGAINVDTLLYGDISGSGGTGAKVYIGETEAGFGVLDFTGEWQNSNITMNLEVGNLTGGALAGVNYDLLDVNGVFVFGGNVSIDLGAANFGSLEELQLISWNSSSGSVGNLSVNFINGSAMNYDVRADGLYLLAIPEPGTVAFLALGALALGFGIRKSRKA